MKKIIKTLLLTLVLVITSILGSTTVLADNSCVVTRGDGTKDYTYCPTTTSGTTTHPLQKKGCYACPPGSKKYVWITGQQAAQRRCSRAPSSFQNYYTCTDTPRPQTTPLSCSDEEIPAKFLGKNTNNLHTFTNLLYYHWQMKDYISYQSNGYKIKIGDKVYDEAFCLDPGLPAAATNGLVCCKQVDEPGAYYLLEQSETGNYDFHTMLMAFRFYAVYVGQAQWSGKPTSLSFIIHLQMIDGNQEVIAEYGENAPWLKGTDEAGAKMLQDAITLAKEARSQTFDYRNAQALEGEKEDFNIATVLVKDENPTTKEATMSIVFSKKTATSSKLKCEKCQIIGSDVIPAGTTKTEVRIKITSQKCDFKLQVLGKQIASLVCSRPGTGYQNYFLKVNDDESVIGEYDGSIDCQICDIDPNKPVIPQKLDTPPIAGNLNNCCNGVATELAEPHLEKDLFSYDDCYQVESNRTKIGTSNYTDKSAEGLYSNGDLDKTYCELYCSERVKVEIPEQITATNGRYFKLVTHTASIVTSTVETAGPVVNGFKRCRVRVKYYDWLVAYMKQVQAEVDRYNDYQENTTWKEMYQDGVDNVTRGRNGRWKLKCWSEAQTATCTHRQVCHNRLGQPYDCSYTWTQHSQTGHQEEGEYDFNYDRFKFPHYNDPKWLIYYEVMLDETLLNRQYDFYNGIKIIDDKKDTRISHSQYSLYGSDKQSMAQHKSNAENKYPYTLKGEEVPGTSKTCGGDSGGPTPNSIWNCSIEPERDLASDINLDWVDEDADQKLVDYTKASDTSANGYAAAAKEAKALENKLFVCDNYFGQYGGTDVEARYKFDPDSGFSYTQVYLDDFGSLTRSETGVNFNKICGEDKVEVANTGLYNPEYLGDLYIEVQDGDDELDQGNYSGIFGSGYSDMQDFRCGGGYDKGIVQIKYGEKYDEPECTMDTAKALLGHSTIQINEHLKFLDLMYKAGRQFTHDARYHKYCYWEEADDPKHTVAQYGDVEQSSINYTIHNKQYEVFLTTLEGTYETHWTLAGLGENGKFDQYIENNGETCAGEHGRDDGFSPFSCKLQVIHEIVHTGKCTADVVNLDLSSCDPNSTTEGYVLYDFKVVDPTNLFPECDSQNAESCFDSMGDNKHAYNWLKESRGQEEIRNVQTSDAYDKKNLSYSFVLSAQDMKEIQEYNEKQISNNEGGYSDFNLVCEKTCNNTPNMNQVSGNQTLYSNDSCSKCISEFITKYGAPGSSTWGNQVPLATIRQNW